MHAASIRAPIFLSTVFLWLGCLGPMGMLPSICALCVAGILVWHTNQAIIAYLTLWLSWGLGWCALSYHQHQFDLPQESITAEWKCDSTDIMEFSRSKALMCSSEWGAFRLEWNHSFAPDFASRILGTASPLRLTDSNWNRWKYQKGVRGTLTPTVPNKHRFDWPSCRSPRDHAWDLLHENFSYEVAGLLLAITTGDKSHLSDRLKHTLSRAGLSHLLAVSGYHVGLVALISVWLLRRKRLLLRFIGLLSLVGIWEFIRFCGSPESAIRAGMMVTLYGVSRLLYRTLSGMQILCLSAWLMLLINPVRAHQLGTQLSFIAVAAILLTLEVITRTPHSNKVSASLAIPISAQAGTSFITWPVFGQFPVHFLLFNLAASPVMVILGFSISIWFLLQISGSPPALVASLTECIQCVIQGIMAWLTESSQRNWTLNVSLLPVWCGWFVSGLFFVGLGIELNRLHRLRFPFVFFSCLVLGIIPWIWLAWQPMLTVAMRNAPYVLLEGDQPALIWNDRDQSAICRLLEQTAHDRQEVTWIKPRAYWNNAQGDWIIRPDNQIALGCIKNRPFSMSQMGDSSVSLAFGADSGQATAWGDPVHFRRYAINSNEANW